MECHDSKTKLLLAAYGAENAKNIKYLFLNLFTNLLVQYLSSNLSITKTLYKILDSSSMNSMGSY